jgi:hypothetical protein
VLAVPEQRAELELVQAHFLGQLPSEGLDVALPGVDAPSRWGPRKGREVELDEQDAVFRVEDERAHAVAPRSHPRSTASASARNQPSRSSHETAAFAGDVDGTTKSRVSSSRRAWMPSSGRSPKVPR